MGDRVYQIGENMPKPDAATKVVGSERFAADCYGEDLLWAGAKMAGIPHARIVAIDTEAARRVAGVVTVLTAADITGSNRQGVIRKDQPVLADDRVYRVGAALEALYADQWGGPLLDKAPELETE